MNNTSESKLCSRTI